MRTSVHRPSAGPASLAVWIALWAGPHAPSGEVEFRHHFADRELPGDSWGQTALVDLDGDGDLDFVTGRSRGEIRWYEFRGPDSWVPHPIADRSPSDVGAIALDVDRDGRPDVVAGGAWFRNPGDRDAKEWTAHVFDAALEGVHDVVAGDIDRDGRTDIVTMSDRNDLRWYRIADDPRDAWKAKRIGPPIHAGAGVGDLDGDGDEDVVRGSAWFENLGSGDGWTERVLTDIPWAPEEPMRGSAKARVVDLNGDGRAEVVLTEAEKNGARIAWFEAPPDPRSGPWKPHILPQSDDAPRGPYHSLAVADFDGDGDRDIFTAEMEHLGKPPHRWFIWENRGDSFVERTILDAGLGTHEAVAGDVDGDGDVDIVGKLWRPVPDNANGGRNHVDFLENLLRSPKAKEKR